jgi:hypothetical protein
VKYLTEVMAHRSLVIVVSDLFDTKEEALRLMRYLRTRRNMLVLFHVLHPDELQFPFTEVTLFESMEDKQAIMVDPGGIRKAYLAQMSKFLQRTRETCKAGRIEYHQVSLADALDRVLLRFLGRDQAS